MNLPSKQEWQQTLIFLLLSKDTIYYDWEVAIFFKLTIIVTIAIVVLRRGD